MSLQIKISITREKSKEKMNLLKKKKPGLKNDNIKRKRQRKMNLQNKGSKDLQKKGHLRKKCSKKDASLKQRKQRLSLKQKENIGNHESTDMQTLTESLIRNFHESVSTGPLYICTCCDQLWYKHSVSPANQLTLKNPDRVKYLQDIVSVDNVKWVCQKWVCLLKKGKVPPCAIVNGTQFPTKPNFFDLNELECRLIAPQLAFQKIYQAPRGGQLKISGNVVNVPADVNSTVNMLPRLADDTGTIKVQLKRILRYKSSALSLNIRPSKVMQAAAWLVNASPFIKIRDYY